MAGKKTQIKTVRKSATKAVTVKPKAAKKPPRKCATEKTHHNRHKLAAIFSALLAASQLFTGGLYMDPSHSLASQMPDVKGIIQDTNAYRASDSVAALTENSLLDQAAQAKLADMQKNNYWDHVSPTGVKPWDFIDKVGYSYAFAGENLGKGFSSAQDVVNAWIASPKHRDNLISKDFTDIGVAVGSATIDGKNSTLIVQMFGKPKAIPTETSSFTSIAMASTSEPSLNIVNPVSESKLPYFILWGILFFLIVFDGIELRRCGLHTNRKHMFEFRSALLVNCFAFLLLFVNIVSLA